MSYYVALLVGMNLSVFAGPADVPDYLDDDVERLLEALDVDPASTWIECAHGRLIAGPEMLRAEGVDLPIVSVVPLFTIRPRPHDTLFSVFNLPAFPICP